MSILLYKHLGNRNILLKQHALPYFDFLIIDLEICHPLREQKPYYVM